MGLPCVNRDPACNHKSERLEAGCSFMTGAHSAMHGARYSGMDAPDSLPASRAYARTMVRRNQRSIHDTALELRCVCSRNARMAGVGEKEEATQVGNFDRSRRENKRRW